MKYKIKPSNTYKKELKKAIKQGKDIRLINDVINKPANGEILDVKYRDHELSGNFKGYRECHILPDWLLIYQIFDGELMLYLARTGTHSELFKK